ncbi:MAG TPA: hypothetical protein PLM14_08615 [Candidatus Hydrogenedentes bacterium]|nr:hypothetical protein [Candidatus Hydrogenedentota bacterium]HQE83050.1 hypothetical protein [Candidatus Hydrogenedentota bacterium]HQM47338.1 hypothetical protein [Candidatus Hydrogenedentota bacterium]
MKSIDVEDVCLPLILPCAVFVFVMGSGAHASSDLVRAPFEDAVAAWHMGDGKDAAGEWLAVMANQPARAHTNPGGVNLVISPS